MNNEQIATLHNHLKNSSRQELREHCAELIAAGVEHKTIIRAMMTSVSACAVSGESWLPTASIINLSDSLVHVPLQLDENKHFMMAFGERHPEFRRVEVPPRIAGSIEELQTRFDKAIRGNDWQLGERCLLGIATEADLNAVFATLLETLLDPRYLGTTSGSWWASVRHLLIGGMIDLRNEFSDETLLHTVCNRGAKQCAKVIGQHSERAQHAIAELESAYIELNADFGAGEMLAEKPFQADVESGDVTKAFGAVTSAWQNGISVDQIDLALTMLCVERLLRGGYGSGANWDNLKRELQATGVIRRAALIDQRLAYKAALHAVWQIVRHGDEGLCDGGEFPEFHEFTSDNEDEHLLYTRNGIGHANARQAMNAANNFLLSGHDPKHLMRDMILWVNQNCKGGGYYAGQRGMLDAWELAKDHPERNRIPLALVGWMADYRNQHFNFKKSYGPIWGANLSDDGGLLAIVSGGTRVFDTKTGGELMFFRGNPWRFAFHPGGRLLAAGWDGGDLQIIDLVARKIVKQWPAFPDDVSGKFGDGKFWGLAFSPDGKLLAGCSRGCNEVHVWDSATWERKFELFGHSNNRIESVTFSADSQRLASGGCDGTVRLWNMQSGNQELVFDKHDSDTGRISGLQFHPDGRRIISSQCNGETKVWDSQTGDEHCTMWPVREYLNYAGFTPNGKTVIFEVDGTLHYHNAETGEPIATVEAVAPKPNDHTIFGGANPSRDRSAIVTAGWHGQVSVWDATTRELIQSFGLKLN